MVDDRTDYSTSIADAFEAGVLQAGGTVLRRDQVMDDDGAELGDLVAKLRASKPDLVFYSGMDTVAGPLLRQIHGAGLNPVFMGSDGICTGELPRLAGAKAMRSTVLCAETGGTEEKYQPALRAFKDRFKQRFGVSTQLFHPMSTMPCR